MVFQLANSKYISVPAVQTSLALRAGILTRVSDPDPQIYADPDPGRAKTC